MASVAALILVAVLASLATSSVFAPRHVRRLDVPGATFVTTTTRGGGT